MQLLPELLIYVAIIIPLYLFSMWVIKGLSWKLTIAYLILMQVVIEGASIFKVPGANNDRQYEDWFKDRIMGMKQGETQ